MKKNLVAILEQAKRSTITLSDLEKVAGPQNTYDDFAANVRILMDEGFLTAVKSHGVNWCGLPNRFRIQKGKVKQPVIEEIQEMQFKVHPAMDLRPYFSGRSMSI